VSPEFWIGNETNYRRLVVEWCFIRKTQSCSTAMAFILIMTLMPSKPHPHESVLSFSSLLYEASLYHHDCGGKIRTLYKCACVRRTLFSTFEEAPQKCEGRWAQWQTFSHDRTKNERIPEKVADDRHIATSKSKREIEDGRPGLCTKATVTDIASCLSISNEFDLLPNLSLLFLNRHQQSLLKPTTKNSNTERDNTGSGEFSPLFSTCKNSIEINLM
jgi:hypothetical protein